MPASMISEDAGSSVKVKGRRMAMVVIGAMPGSTPTRVPISAPRKQKPRLAGVSATAKPVARFAIRSTRRGLRGPSDARPGPASPWPDPDRQAETEDEQRDREGGEADRQQRILAQARVGRRKAGAEDDGEARKREARPRQQQGEKRHRDPDQGKRAQGHARQALAAREERACRHAGADQDDQD